MKEELLQRLLETRRDLVTASREVHSWMKAEGLLGNLVHASQAPSWGAYQFAESAWKAALEQLDAAIERGQL